MKQASAIRYLTPPQYAERLGVSADKVVGWIVRGELRAVDTSTNAGSGKPRWKISPEAIAEFEARRSSSKPAAKRRRRKRTAEVLDII